jgi:hypothetical protein
MFPPSALIKAPSVYEIPNAILGSQRFQGKRQTLLRIVCASAKDADKFFAEIHWTHARAESLNMSINGVAALGRL